MPREVRQCRLRLCCQTNAKRSSIACLAGTSCNGQAAPFSNSGCAGLEGALCRNDRCPQRDRNLEGGLQASQTPFCPREHSAGWLLQRSRTRSAGSPNPDIHPRTLLYPRVKSGLKPPRQAISRKSLNHPEVLGVEIVFHTGFTVTHRHVRGTGDDATSNHCGTLNSSRIS
jgi:hypothetical protein